MLRAVSSSGRHPPTHFLKQRLYPALSGPMNRLYEPLLYVLHGVKPPRSQ